MELRISLRVDDDSNSGTEDIQGFAVRDLLQPPPAGLTVPTILLDPPISSPEYPDFLIDYGKVSGGWCICQSCTSGNRFTQKHVCLKWHTTYLASQPL